MIYLDSNQTLEDLFKVHGAYVFNLALSITKRHHLAEDVAQDVFIKFLEKDIVFRNKDPRHLLSRMTYNRALDVLRGQKTRQKHQSALRETAALEISVNYDDNQKVIQEVINSLEDKLRLPLVMRFMGGSKLQEIAKELKVPLPTIQKRVEKGLALMKAQLEQKGFAALVPLLEDFLCFKNVSITWNDAFIDQIKQTIATQKTAGLAAGVAKFKAVASAKVAVISLLIVSSVGISGLAIDEDFKWDQPFESFAQIMDFSSSSGSFQKWIGDKLSFVNPFQNRDSQNYRDEKKFWNENYDSESYPNQSKGWEIDSKTLSTGPLDKKDSLVYGKSKKSSDEILSTKKSKKDPLAPSNKKTSLKKIKTNALDPTQFLLGKDGKSIINLDFEGSEDQINQEDLESETQDEEGTQEAEESSGEEDVPEEGDAGGAGGPQDDDESDEDEPAEDQDEGEGQGPPENPEDDGDTGADEEDASPLPENLRFSLSATGSNLDPKVPPTHIQTFVINGLFQSTLVSESMSGVVANHDSYGVISNNGQYVALESSATNLVVLSLKDNSKPHIYVKNLIDGSMTLASVSTSGQPANKQSQFPSISADGRYICFSSRATNLDPEVTSHDWNVYLHDRFLKTTVLVNRLSGENGAIISLPNLFGFFGRQSLSVSGRFVAFTLYDEIIVRDVFEQTTQFMNLPFNTMVYPSISEDGRYISFFASNSHAGNTYFYVHDRQEGVTHIAARNTSGNPVVFPSGLSLDPAFISNDGQKVIFSSTANDLIQDDNNGHEDVFVSHWSTGQIERVSVSNSGKQAKGRSYSPRFSASGRYVIFHSKAKNLTNDLVDGEMHHVYIRDLFNKQTYLASKNGDQPLNVSSFGSSIAD